MPKQRDYKAEYARRIASGLARGLSKSQSRGHPGVGQIFASGLSKYSKPNDQLEQGVKLMRSGQSLASSARTLNVNPERLKNYIIGQGVGHKQSGRWHIGEDNRIREMRIYSSNQKVVVKIKGYDNSRLAGEYMNAVRQYLSSGDTTYLDPFRGGSVTDVNGKRHVFETRPNVIYRLSFSGAESFEDIYRITHQ